VQEAEERGTYPKKFQRTEKSRKMKEAEERKRENPRGERKCKTVQEREQSRCRGAGAVQEVKERKSRGRTNVTRPRRGEGEQCKRNQCRTKIPGRYSAGESMVQEKMQRIQVYGVLSIPEAEICRTMQRMVQSSSRKRERVTYAEREICTQKPMERERDPPKSAVVQYP